jgi:hypothetical protein
VAEGMGGVRSPDLDQGVCGAEGGGEPKPTPGVVVVNSVGLARPANGPGRSVSVA